MGSTERRWHWMAGAPSYRREGKPLRTERVENGMRLLLRPLRLDLPGEPLEVPAGFVTDYSSVPWFLAWVVRWSKVDLAGVAHDRLYATGRYGDRVCSRAEADRVWREVAMSGKHRANTAQAWGGWLVLRGFGWAVWYPYRWDWRQPPATRPVEADGACCLGRAGAGAQSARFPSPSNAQNGLNATSQT